MQRSVPFLHNALEARSQSVAQLVRCAYDPLPSFHLNFFAAYSNRIRTVVLCCERKSCEYPQRDSNELSTQEARAGGRKFCVNHYSHFNRASGSEQVTTCLVIA